MKHIFFTGGLGNQMFQYAFYLSMKDKGISCKLNTSAYQYLKMHNGYELERVFGVEGEYDSDKSHIYILWVRLLRKYQIPFLVFKDRDFEYCPEVYTAKQSYLDGLWISPHYFETIREKVLKCFSFKNISVNNIEIVKEISSVNSVSLHIRRGDYLNSPNYNVCDEKYYEQAIHHINSVVKTPVYYVFSDDPEWCKYFMNTFNVQFKIVDWNKGKDSYQDMFLMSQCKHNIIANSTFSWWGAWLNTNEKKIIVAPHSWFRNNDKSANCEGWCLI